MVRISTCSSSQHMQNTLECVKEVHVVHWTIDGRRQPTIQVVHQLTRICKKEREAETTFDDKRKDT